jgi:O-antigen/teichoic acid export membrane protein
LSELGVYAIAVRIAQMPRAGLAQMIHNVIFPLYSRTLASKDEVMHADLAKVRRSVLVAAGWMIAGFIGTGDLFIRIVYRSEYHEAGWILQLLGAGVWMGLIENLAGAWLLGIGQPRWFAIGSGVKAASLPALLLLGFRVAGLAGAIVTLVLAEAVRYVVVAIPVARKGGKFWREDLALTLRVLATGGVGAWAGAALKATSMSDLLEFAMVSALVTALWLPDLAPLARSLLKGARRHG